MSETPTPHPVSCGPHFPSVHWKFWGPPPQEWPHTDPQSPLAAASRGSAIPKVPEELSSFSSWELAHAHSRQTKVLNLLRPFSGSLGSSGLLGRQPATWFQPHSQFPGELDPGLWASEQTAH